MYKIFFFALAVVFVAAASLRAWELPEFMISTWGGPEFDDDNAKAAGLIKAGLNTAMWDVDKLDVLRKHGLKALVNGATTEQASKLKGDPVIWGYHLVGGICLFYHILQRIVFFFLFLIVSLLILDQLELNSNQICQFWHYQYPHYSQYDHRQ